MRLTAVAWLFLAFLLAALLPLSARAQCVSSFECIHPSHSCVYIGVGVMYGSSFWQRTFDLEDASSCDPFPGLGGSSVDSYDAFPFTELSYDGVNYQSYYGAARAQLQVRLSTVADNGIDKTVQTEILAMDIALGSLPPFILIRESPTLPSLGQAQSHTQGDGTFVVDSFFDVFTELSFDTGQTWTPSSGSLRIVLMQAPPLPTQGTTWGSVKAMYR